ncbi:ABC transporter ATP-binding protein [Macrococcus capreoli]|uniref:ABC transporter ATP-binding protein n=1 Tax=Macrococcus capreoli TaxID=2982690 RepID=UPI0021D5B588|nr:ABC transporter ATP-binding protein [Macrococcus sp. TMW 2.2395]MCU7557685.1 ABC transporter ATP-binding protein [Macrococcus sp. TMW 2.2395]
MTVLSLKQVTKSFGERKIIDNVSLDFEQGKIYGFIGPNGSGKTTTIRMILGLLPLDSGTIKVHNEDVNYGETKTNRFIGYLPDVPEYYHYMNAREYLTLCARITQVSKHEFESRISELISQVGLTDDNKRISKYSRGMKQRLGIAQALIHNPDILICDEPTSALDPKGRQEILSILEKIKSRTTVIFSTHILSDVERICDEVIVLTRHQIINLKTLNASRPKKNIHVRLHVKDSDKLKIAQAYKIKEDSQFSIVELENDNLEGLYRSLNDLQIYPQLIEVIDDSLESIYMEVTT